MPKLTIPAFLRNVASVFCRRHGAVTARAHEAGCSRQALYDQARRLRQRLQDEQRRRQQAQLAGDQLRQQLQQLRAQGRHAVTIDDAALQRFVVTAQAMGISLRQAEELLGTLLPADRVPDHTTLGRWTAAAARRAGAVLAVLDPVCAPAVKTLGVDEIFFGGSRRWWRSSRSAWRWSAVPRPATGRGRRGSGR